jgi:hypothetical protein
MSTYTVKGTMPTGKSHDQFGTEFYVQFEEMSDTPALWFKKNLPSPGDTLDLKQENGKWKKVKKEWNTHSPSSSEQSSDSSSQPSSRRSPYKDNSEGMRVGMCINNAANYVNSLEFPQALTDAEWAETVVAYAKALFVRSEFHQEATDQPVTAADVFANGQD